MLKLLALCLAVLLSCGCYRLQAAAPPRVPSVGIVDLDPAALEVTVSWSAEPMGYDPLVAFLAFWQDAEVHGGDPTTCGLRATVHPQLHPCFAITLGDAAVKTCPLIVDGKPQATDFPGGVHAYGGTGFNCGSVLAVDRLAYADGSSETAKSELTRICDFDDAGALESLPRVWHGSLGQFGDGWLHRWDWSNPHPERPIKSLTLTPSAGSTVILAGVSGLN